MNNVFDFLGRAGVILFITILHGPDEYSFIFKAVTVALILLWFWSPFLDDDIRLSKQGSKE